MPSTKSLVKQSERHAKVGMQHPKVGIRTDGSIAGDAVGNVAGIAMLAIMFWPVTLGAYLLYRASRKKSK